MFKLILKLFIIFIFLNFVTYAQAATYDFQKGNITSIRDTQKITNPENYHYVFGFLGKGQETINYHDFDLINYVPNMQVVLMIPDSEKNTKFRPGMVLINPYLLPTQEPLPFGFPYGVNGAVYIWNDENSFYNKEIMQNFIVGPTFAEGLTAGNYKIAVFDPSGVGGRYILKVGAQDSPRSLTDLFHLVWVIFRTKLNIY